MKNICLGLTIFLMILGLNSCQEEYDDTELQERVKKNEEKNTELEKRIKTLEDWQKSLAATNEKIAEIDNAISDLEEITSDLSAEDIIAFKEMLTEFNRINADGGLIKQLEEFVKNMPEGTDAKTMQQEIDNLKSRFKGTSGSVTDIIEQQISGIKIKLEEVDNTIGDFSEIENYSSIVELINTISVTILALEQKQTELGWEIDNKIYPIKNELNGLKVILFADYKIERDPELIGGEDLEMIIRNNTSVEFKGHIKWYGSDALIGRTAGNRVGIKITAPTLLGKVKGNVTLTLEDGTVFNPWDNWMEGDNYFYFNPKFSENKKYTWIKVNWGSPSYFEQTYYISVNYESTFEEPWQSTSVLFLDTEYTKEALEYDVVENVMTINSGEIKYYGADENLGIEAGNRIGLKITAPDNITDFSKAILKYKKNPYEPAIEIIEDGAFLEEDGTFNYKLLIPWRSYKADFVIYWDGTSKKSQSYTVDVKYDVTLEPKPQQEEPEV